MRTDDGLPMVTQADVLNAYEKGWSEGYEAGKREEMTIIFTMEDDD